MNHCIKCKYNTRRVDTILVYCEKKKTNTAMITPETPYCFRCKNKDKTFWFTPVDDCGNEKLGFVIQDGTTYRELRIYDDYEPLSDWLNKILEIMKD